MIQLLESEDAYHALLFVKLLHKGLKAKNLLLDSLCDVRLHYL